MAKLFGMLPREIAKRDNVSASTVSSMIKRTYEQIIKGRVVLINPTPKEVTEAEERIQKALARRKGYRDANREEINAKRRKTYAEIND